jgi:hypothetical protein
MAPKHHPRPYGAATPPIMEKLGYALLCRIFRIEPASTIRTSGLGWPFEHGETIRRPTPTSVALDIESRQERPAFQRAGAGIRQVVPAGVVAKLPMRPF